jgi:NNP family nitrate/nitrite transporter-like MFS transporter
MIGGLGGFVLPIAFGALNDLTGLWTGCFMLLFAICVGSLIWMHVSIRQMERDGRQSVTRSESYASVAAE